VLPLERLDLACSQAAEEASVAAMQAKNHAGFDVAISNKRV
jgi:hypothetical protein